MVNIFGTECRNWSARTQKLGNSWFLHSYRYEVFSSSSNSTISVIPCLQDRNSGLERTQTKIQTGCEKEAGISMWIYVLLGNLLRGIGETPIQPLGIAYIDDYAPEESVPFYIGTVEDREFLPSLKSLLGNPVYFLYLCSSIVQFNSLIGMVTYKPKYIEQQFGQSSSKTNFIIGMVEEVLVAGNEADATFNKPISSYEQTLFSECNAGCACSKNEWDPICGENGITYISACLAGCKTSNGSGKNMIFYDCSCVDFPEASPRHSSAILGPCPQGKECSKMFLYFLVISVIASYTLSVGGTPGYILLLRCINPQLKSFALGIYTLTVRVL
ncbi:PREDICTED: solute carrier organic anion transporter family member 1C1-like, partial [Thamnophis sirtalis]|uniref:Solute carrier organic anion transporter family member 1C1 n=1 Tax=Thamnophis sirtalis TaxID=35019 RepID=A0A6I9Z1Q4_9SAUR